MGTKIKGIYKGFKSISQIFVVNKKEHEFEIGCPTDVKHVAHIGWDGPSGSAPTWMDEFKTASDYAATSIGNINEARGSTWSSQDFESADPESIPGVLNETPPTDLPKVPKKHRRKKNKSTSSPKSSSSTRSRTMKSKSKFVNENTRQANIEVM